MRSIIDYIDDYLYLKDLKKSSISESYIVHDSDEAREALKCITPRVEALNNDKQDVQDELNIMYEQRAAYDAEIDRLIDEYRQKNTAEPVRSDFEFSEYKALTDAIEKYEKRLSSITSELEDLKSRKKNLESIRSINDVRKDFERTQKKPAIVGLCYIIIIIHMLKELICFFLALGALHIGYINSNPFYLIFWSLFPIVVFIWGTCYPEWRYENRKMHTLILVISVEFVHAVSLTARLLYPFLASVLFKIKLTSAIDEGMVVNLVRTVTFMVSVIPFLILYYAVLKYINLPEIKKNILYFKYSRGKDYRKHKEYKYDLRIMRKLGNASIHLIKENDRFLHMFVSGATGTGKTSSTLMPMIQSDLDQTVKNTNAQKRVVAKMMKEGKLEKTAAFTDRDFSLSFFKPASNLSLAEQDEISARLKKIQETMPIAGQMVCAPNEGMADDAYDLAVKRNISHVYRIDPIRDQYGRKKEGWIGFNPLFISPHIKGDARVDEITVRATIVKDILNNLQKSSGKTDAYFEGVNSVQTTTVSELLMLTFEDLNYRQPTLIDVQNCLNDFSEIRPYYFQLIRKYGNNGNPMPENAKGIEKGLSTNKSFSPSDYHNNTTEFFRLNHIYCGAWHHIFVTIRDTLLHPTEGPVQFDRARGLRDQYNLFLSDQRIRDIYEAPNVMDLDDVLLHGGIIIFNYALELGQATSAAFGTFFLIMYSKAVLRRNIHSYLIPFYTYIDEFPTLINKNLEELFSLHRQYRSANTVAFQTLDQMDRTPETRYFKNVLLSNCAHKIIFGRITADEMRLYEQLSGKKFESLDQATISETSILSDNPSISYSRRSTPNKVAVLEGSDMNYRDFQEGTVFTVDDGEPLYPFFIKMDFLLDVEKKSPPRIEVNWDQWPPYYVGSAYQYDNGNNTHAAAFARQPVSIYGSSPYKTYSFEPLPDSKAYDNVKTQSYSSIKFSSGRENMQRSSIPSVSNNMPIKPQEETRSTKETEKPKAQTPDDAFDRFLNGAK